MTSNPSAIDWSRTGEFLGKLFSSNHQDELKRVLRDKVTEALRNPSPQVVERIPDVVDHLLDDWYSTDKTVVTLRVHGVLLGLSTKDNSRGLCAGCETAECCRYFKIIEVSARDIMQMSAQLQVSKDKFTKEHCKRIALPFYGLVYVLKHTMPCEFLRADKYCGVYEVRPEVCRAWPFSTDKDEPKVTRAIAKPFCNFIFNLLLYEVILRMLDWAIES